MWNLVNQLTGSGGLRSIEETMSKTFVGTTNMSICDFLNDKFLNTVANQIAQLNLHKHANETSIVSNNSAYFPDMDESDLVTMLNCMSSSKPSGHENLRSRDLRCYF